MNWPFRRKAEPTASDAGRLLNERRRANERELKRMRVHQLCAEMGKPVPEVFR